MKTRILSGFKTPLTGRKTRLRAKTAADAERDYRWQTDAETARLDATLPLEMTFARYLIEYQQMLREHSPTRRLFAIETMSGEHIGNLSYYGINEEKDEAELGIIIGQRDYRDKGYGTDAVNTLLRHIFSHTSLKRITLKTLAGNIQAQKCFLKCGFTPSGEKTSDGHHFLLMDTDLSQWLMLTGKSAAPDKGAPETDGAG